MKPSSGTQNWILADEPPLLAPVLDKTLQWCRQSENQPQFVSIANGPGSFTGLRIGVTTAKTLAYAADLPVIAVDSLAAIAALTLAQQPECEKILVGINAYRGQVFTARFERASLLIPLAALSDSAAFINDRADSQSTNWSTHPDQVQVVDAEQWGQFLRAVDPGDHVTGDRKVFQQRRDLSFIQRELPDAIGVGLLAARAAILGTWSDPLALVPRYFRPSAAEEKAERAPDPLRPRSA